MIIKFIIKISDIMKEKIVKTDQATVLVVEFPECRGVISDNQGKRICFHTEKGWDWIWQPNGMFGKLELLGRLPDITEEQAVKTVDESIHSGLYAHYVKEVNPPNVYRYRSSRDSLHSLLQANEVYFENPLGDKYIPENCPIPECHQEWTMNQYDTECIKSREEHYFQWQDAQSKVWDKERTYLFIKVD